MTRYDVHHVRLWTSMDGDMLRIGTLWSMTVGAMYMRFFSDESFSTRFYFLSTRVGR